MSQQNEIAFQTCAITVLLSTEPDQVKLSFSINDFLVGQFKIFARELQEHSATDWKFMADLIKSDALFATMRFKNNCDPLLIHRFASHVMDYGGRWPIMHSEPFRYLILQAADENDIITVCLNRRRQLQFQTMVDGSLRLRAVKTLPFGISRRECVCASLCVYHASLLCRLDAAGGNIV